MFAKNTTEAINKLARSLPIAADAVVLTTLARAPLQRPAVAGRARTVHVRAGPTARSTRTTSTGCSASTPGGSALLAVCGASNVTGVVPPIHELAAKVHAAGGRILVDAAQLAAHRPIDMRPHDDPGHLDFVALSAHKMYAPFGSGALIGAAVLLRRRARSPRRRDRAAP